MIRRVAPTDADLLKRVRLAALADTPSAFGRTYAETVAYDDEYWVESAKKRSVGPNEANFFSLDGDHVTGLVGGWRETSDQTFVELVSMWVEPAYRGSGAATALVDAVIGWAAANGNHSVDLWVTVGNDRAIEFYRKCGFAEIGHTQPLPSDPTKQELRMRRAL